jgi:hypothetical protein
MTTLAPIALFVYNRPRHTHLTVDALLKNELAGESDLIVFSDGAKDSASSQNVEDIRQYLRTISGFKSVRIVERECNFGLASSIISGVTQIINEYGRIIVIEDDLVTSPFFLRYMNDALEYYENEDRVISIHGYCYSINGLPETFFLKGADCWGWATWKRGWDIFELDGRKLLEQLKQKGLLDRFDFFGAYGYTQMLRDQIEGKNNSWAIRWQGSAFVNDKLTLYPSRSLVLNIGFDGSGVHCAADNRLDVVLSEIPVQVSTIDISESLFALEQFQHFLNKLKPSWPVRIKEKISRILHRLL